MSRPRKFITLALGLVIAASGCNDLQSPNVNNSDLTELTVSPTRVGIAQSMTGLVAGTRSYIANDNDLVILLGILGRNAYSLDIADPRFITELLEGNLEAGSSEFGGNIWARPFENIRLSQIVLDAINAAPATELSEGERAAARGFVRTVRALDLLNIVNTRDVNCDGNLGCPITVAENPTELAPAVDKRAVFEEIINLLDQGASELQQASNAGAEIIAALPSGFDGFDTAATFRQFNRALAARVLTYMGKEFDASFWSQALVALEESFMDPQASLDLGVFYNFAASTGDQENQLFQPGMDPNIRAHPSVVGDAAVKENGELDDRVTRKTRPITFRQLRNVGSDVGFSLYNSPDAPVPIIRNEELILLRAEANIGLGNLEAGRADINLIRDRSGGLPPVDPFSDRESAIDQLLFEKRYSLLFEGGHRWIDVRRWDRVETLPLDLPDHRRNVAFPVPLEETIGR